MEATSQLLVSFKNLADSISDALEKNHDNLSKVFEEEFDHEKTEAQEKLRSMRERAEKASEFLSLLNDTVNLLSKITSEIRIEETQN